MKLRSTQFHLVGHVRAVVVSNLTLAMADFSEDICLLAIAVEKVIMVIPRSLSALAEPLHL